MTETVKDLKAAALKRITASTKRVTAINHALGKVAEVAPATAKGSSDPSEINLSVADVPGESIGVTGIKKILTNKVHSALVLSDLVFRSPETLPVLDFAAVLREHGEKAASGDMAHLKSTLAVQAIVLDNIFTEFARRAALAKTNDDLERMLRLALKAQSQSRTTIESLAVVHQGPTIFARNANVNNGQQQVNNGVPVPAAAMPTHARTGGENTKSADQTIGKVAHGSVDT